MMKSSIILYKKLKKKNKSKRKKKKKSKILKLWKNKKKYKD